MSSGDFERLDGSDQKDYSRISTNDQLSQFASCLKKCHPFVNHLLLVQDATVFNNCWCPICPAIIDWMKEQCSGLDIMMKPCTQKGRYKAKTIYGYLKQKKKCLPPTLSENPTE